MKTLIAFLIFLTAFLQSDGLHARGACKFVQISDPQFGFMEKEDFSRAKELMEAAVREINIINPDFVVITGDMVNSPSDDMQFEAYKETLAGIDRKIPIYHIPGNHDIGKCTTDNIRSYISRFGYDRFAFRRNGCAFIGLNSSVIKEDTQKEEIQYSWLKRQLKRMRKSDMIFIFTHIPIILSSMDEPDGYSNFPVAMRKKYISLFAEYGVTAVISGHLHNCTECTAEGIDLIVSGPCGLPLGNGKSGFTIVTTDTNGYDYRFIATDL